MLGKILRTVGIVLLLLCLFFFSVVIALFYQFPWWASFFFFVFFIGAFYGGSFVYRKMRQAKFLRLDIRMRSKSERRSHIRAQFTSMMKYTRLAKKADQRVVPWLMMMGSPGAGKTASLIRARVLAPVNSVDPNAPIEADKTFRHWLLENSVVIDTPGGLVSSDDEDGSSVEKEWRQLSRLLSKNIDDMMFKGIVIAISVDELRQDQDALVKLGAEIRKRVDELSSQLGRLLSVYVMVTKSDHIHGFTEFSSSLPHELRQQTMGYVIDDSRENEHVQVKVNQALNSVADRLEAITLMLLNSTGNLSSPVMMLGQEIRLLEDNLIAFSGSLFKDYYYFERPIFRGVFFTSAEHVNLTADAHSLTALNDFMLDHSETQTLTEGLYLRDFYVELLYKDMPPIRPLLYVEKKRSNRVYGTYVTWWAFCIFSSVYLGFAYSNAVKQLNELQEKAKKRDNQFGTSLHKNVLLNVSEYQDVLIVKKIHDQWEFRVWPFSRTFDQILDIYRQHFVKNFQTVTIGLLDKELERSLTYHDKLNPSASISYYVQNMISRVNLLQARVDGQDKKYMDKLQVPRIDKIGIGARSEGPFGDLYKQYILWNTNEVKLREELGYLRRLIDDLELYKTSFSWLINWANTQPDITPVTLSTFWPSILNVPSKMKRVTVEPAFTNKGANAIYKFLANLQAVQPNPAEYEKYEFTFRVWYAVQREHAWRKFLSEFGVGLDSLRNEEDWFTALHVPLGHSPYFDVLDTLKGQFTDMSLIKLPDWLQVVKQINRYQALAESRLDAEDFKKSGYFQRLNKVAQKITDSISGDEEDEGEVSEKVLTLYVDYLRQLSDISEQAVNMGNADAFDVAKTFYTNQNFDEQSLLYKAFGSYQMIRYYLTKQYALRDSASDVWSLLRGPLDLYMSSVVMRSSCHIQNEWKNQVLGNPTVATSLSSKQNVLFGKAGIVSDFIRANVLPFVTYTSHGYESKEVFGHHLAFSEQFYRILNVQQELAFQEQRRKALNDTVSTDAYIIRITSYPSEVNNGAQTLPIGTKLNIRCGAAGYHLDAYNFNASSVLPWEMQGCSETRLEVDFGAFKVEKVYEGSDGFMQFLRDFKSGEQVFSKYDFGEHVDTLTAYDIDEVIVRYSVFGIEDLYPQIDEYLNIKAIIDRNMNKGNEELELPGVITKCWGRE